MPKKRTARFLVPAIIFTFLAVIYFLLGYIMGVFYSDVSEQNTVEYSAEVEEAGVSFPTDENNLYWVKLRGSDTILWIFGRKADDLSALRSLAAGQTVSYRIRTRDVAQLGQKEIVEPVSLSADGIEIFSLKSTNEYFSQIRRASFAVGVFAFTLFMAIAVGMYFSFGEAKKRYNYEAARWNAMQQYMTLVR